MEEIWKLYKITGLDKYHHISIYEGSTEGNIRRNKKIVKPTLNKRTGYLYICGEPVHRIIATIFIPNPDNKPCIDHIDGNKQNNRVENLRWTTHKENVNNPVTKQKMIDNHCHLKGENWKLYGKPLSEEHRKKISEGKKGKHISEEHRQHLLGINKGKTWKVINGKRVWIEKED